ncbi:MAG: bifunctional 5,10-methylenetetrahydrofolate dehydrogenase/5,10-methenyltetrahydrofolate cyclohydrolase [Candidatus Aenigmarchaeota archaeon]|nr:bifunctional 5,10-methylenetetrahydrofolate dehydrogenase/5,10-methenyltetrahydrofolate cyclohydrolase [Candidatus Aenigmarchaeota archaeon]
MPCRIIDGKKIADKYLAETRKYITEHGIRPKLATILVGDDPASLAYVKIKRKTCESAGIETEIMKLEPDEDLILGQIDRLNADKKVDGILVQLPLPPNINTQKIIERIDAWKDVDGLHPLNIGRLYYGDETIAACTPAGIVKILEDEKVRIEGSAVAIIGRSVHVGKPLYSLLYNRNATVTMCHTRTKGIAEIISKADIVVIAVGKPLFLKAEMIKDGAVVIDVGTNKVGNRIVGDADFDSVKKKAAAVTPVPGGVGPMTVAMLAKNTLDAFRRQENG